MSNFKDQEQASYTADPATVDLSVIIETYKALLTSDNLTEPVAVQTVVLQTLLDAAAAATAKPVDVTAGLEQAAKFIDQRIAEYVQEHGVTDPETGTVEFPGWGDEYVDELEELSDAIRTISPAEPVDQWQDITTIGEREHGRLIIVGTRDGKGRWCATIRRTTRVIEERNSSITGALKNTMRLKWEPTHFIELTALNSVAGR